MSVTVGVGIKTPDLLEPQSMLFLRILLAYGASPPSPAGLVPWRPVGRRPLSVTAEVRIRVQEAGDEHLAGPKSL